MVRARHSRGDHIAVHRRRLARRARTLCPEGIRADGRNNHHTGLLRAPHADSRRACGRAARRHHHGSRLTGRAGRYRPHIHLAHRRRRLSRRNRRRQPAQAPAAYIHTPHRRGDTHAHSHDPIAHHPQPYIPRRRGAALRLRPVVHPDRGLRHGHSLACGTRRMEIDRDTRRSGAGKRHILPHIRRFRRGLRLIYRIRRAAAAAAAEVRRRHDRRILLLLRRPAD